MIRKYILLLFAFLVIQKVQAQTVEFKKFDRTPEVFITQMEQWMKTSNSQEVKQFTEDFVKRWNSGFFIKQLKDSMIAFSNAMLDRKLRVDPEFIDYYTCVVNFVQGKQAMFNFGPWHQGLRSLVNQKNKRLAAYLLFSKDLFKDNSINLSSSNRWYLAGKNFEIALDSVPKLIIRSTTLTCFSRNIYTRINNTQGVCYPLDKIWKGEGGTVTWSRVNLDSNKVYAELPKYKINLGAADFVVDSVQFYHKDYFAAPIPGRLTEKLTVNKGPDDDDYPKFDSYKSDYAIKNIFPDVNYRGGFAMTGNRFRGSGTNNDDAEIKIYKGGKLTVQALAASFVIYKDKIGSSGVKATLYLGIKDSIYHPFADFKYLKEGRKLLIAKGEEGVGRAVFSDSYHKLTIDIESISWPMDKDMVDFGTIASRSTQEGVFESDYFYKDFRYRKIEGLAEVSPLYTLKKLVDKRKDSKTTIDAYANAYKLQPVQVLDQLRDLVTQGFIRMNERKGEILVLPKVVNYVRFYQATKDYDVIRLRSLAKETNAVMNMSNLDLTLKGVGKFFLSDSQSVYIVPLNGDLTMKNDLNMTFGGQVHSGLFDFYGKDFSFDYESFKVKLEHVDSMKFQVRGKPDADGVERPFEVRSVVEDVSGQIAVDEHDNKSGLKDYPQYPMFESTKNSYVYYDKRNKQGRVYDRKRFFFTVYPFKVDSMDIVTSSSDLIFAGEMFTDEIFPLFKEALVLRPDSSLGFLTHTPSEGFVHYRSKGQYYEDIDLSNRGFFGAGRMEYLRAKANSKSFLFFLDSMNTNADLYTIDKNELTAQLNAPTPYLHWEPYNDSLFSYNVEKPQELYDLKATHTGELVYTPRDLTGRGSTFFNNAIHTSRYTKFAPDIFTADTASLKINSETPSVFALESDNCRSKVDFSESKGTFVPNNTNQLVAFPFNQYKTSLNAFTWYFNEFKVDFTPPLGRSKEDNYLLSVHPDQDSLKFLVENVSYDLKNYLLDAGGVKSILVADAEIFPDGGKVQIRPKAEMQQLQNARVTADQEHKYHLIYEANINVLGKKKYIGNGSYDYVDKDKKVQKLIFTQINVDTGLHTVAKAILNESNDFKFGPHFNYYGDAILHANEKLLSFDGFARMIEKSEGLDAAYFKFEGKMNPDTIQFPVDSIIKGADNRKLAVGFLLDNLTANNYGGFLSNKLDASDHIMASAKGSVIYDEKKKVFKIGQPDKLFGESYKGNFLSFSDTAEKVYFEGLFDLGLQFDKKSKIALQAAGQGVTKLLESKTDLNLLMTFDFPLQKDAYKQFLAQVKNNTVESMATRLDTVGFYKAISELVPEKSAQRAIDGLQLFGVYKNTGDLNQTMVLSNLKMTWDQASKSYKSVGKFGILTIGDEEVGKMVNGSLQIVRKTGEDIINLYFECGDRNTWFFLTYRGGVLEAISSDPVFNDYLGKKAKKKDPYTLSTPKKKVDFLRDFNNQ